MNISRRISLSSPLIAGSPCRLCTTTQSCPCGSTNGRILCSASSNVRSSWSARGSPSASATRVPKARVASRANSSMAVPLSLGDAFVVHLRLDESDLGLGLLQRLVGFEAGFDAGAQRDQRVHRGGEWAELLVAVVGDPVEAVGPRH